MVQHLVLLDLLNVLVLGVSDDVDSIVGSGSNLRGKLVSVSTFSQPLSNLHNMDVVQFLALLGHALSPEAISITALAIARSVVTVSNFPVLAHGTETFLPEANTAPLLL